MREDANDKPRGIGGYRVTASRGKWLVLLLLTIIAASLLSPWASSRPDGLERVAEDHGFIEEAEALHELAPIPDYEVGGIPWTPLRVGLAGLVGVGAMIGVLWLLSRGMAGARRNSDAS